MKSRRNTRDDNATDNGTMSGTMIEQQQRPAQHHRDSASGRSSSVIAQILARFATGTRREPITSPLGRSVRRASSHTGIWQLYDQLVGGECAAE